GLAREPGGACGAGRAGSRHPRLGEVDSRAIRPRSPLPWPPSSRHNLSDSDPPQKRRHSVLQTRHPFPPRERANGGEARTNLERLARMALECLDRSRRLGRCPMIRPDPVRRVLVGVTCLAWLVGAEPAAAQKPKSEEETTREFRALAWQRGPTDGHMGGTATIKVGDGQAFLDGQNTRRFLELNGNPPRDNHYTLVSQDPNWFAVFHFEDRGYVKDDEKLDPGAILKALKDSDEPGNAERKRLGMAPLYTDGWHVPPHYDAATRRLEWGVRLRGDTGPPVVNYTVRILGRRGVMSATPVPEPQRLD